jgi:hypothetical protein
VAAVSSFFIGAKKVVQKEVKEGFKQESSSSEDEDEELVVSKPTGERRTAVFMKMPSSSKLKSALKSRDAEIAELEGKLESREQQIQ